MNTQLHYNDKDKYSLPVINSIIGGEEILLLVDTGASTSILQKSVFDKIKHDPQIIKHEEGIKIPAITEHELKIIGSFTIPFRICKKQ